MTSFIADTRSAGSGTDHSPESSSAPAIRICSSISLDPLNFSSVCCTMASTICITVVARLLSCCFPSSSAVSVRAASRSQNFWSKDSAFSATVFASCSCDVEARRISMSSSSAAVSWRPAPSAPDDDDDEARLTPVRPSGRSRGASPARSLISRPFMEGIIGLHMYPALESRCEPRTVAVVAAAARNTRFVGATGIGVSERHV
mmetsp:Transcript_8665/g.23545  ORF Transcript_8665/g.23545 Transcript_8665/m.23545 type:complete len:203 (+) Transcript_8665:422-1030(+)